MLKWLSSLFQAPDIEGYLSQNAVIIDVRSPGEFKSGHVRGSKNIPLNQIGQKVEAIKKWNKPVIACCRSGNRSGIAARQLKKAGIDVINGGSWQNVNRFTR